MNNDIALKNLVDLDHVLKSIGIKCWLTAGTLLGYYRDGNFIGHDSDVDIGIDAEHVKPELFRKIIDSGFEITESFGSIADGFVISVSRESVKVDLYFFYKVKDFSYHSVYSHFTESKCIKHDYVYRNFDLKEIFFLGHSFYAPTDTESYIMQQYGESFRSPVKEWSYVYSPKNVIHTEKVMSIDETLNDLRHLQIDLMPSWIAGVSSSDLLISDLKINKKVLGELHVRELIDMYRKISFQKNIKDADRRNSIFLLKLAPYFLGKSSPFFLACLHKAFLINLYLPFDCLKLVGAKFSRLIRVD
jgi:hypothetical protein